MATNCAAQAVATNIANANVALSAAAASSGDPVKIEAATKQMVAAAQQVSRIPPPPPATTTTGKTTSLLEVGENVGKAFQSAQPARPASTYQPPAYKSPEYKPLVIPLIPLSIQTQQPTSQPNISQTNSVTQMQQPQQPNNTMMVAGIAGGAALLLLVVALAMRK
jgi:hypothetical protein